MLLPELQPVPSPSTGEGKGGGEGRWSPHAGLIPPIPTFPRQGGRSKTPLLQIEYRTLLTLYLGGKPSNLSIAGARVQRFSSSHVRREEERHRMGRETHHTPREDPHVQNPQRRNAQHCHRRGGKTR